MTGSPDCDPGAALPLEGRFQIAQTGRAHYGLHHPAHRQPPVAQDFRIGEARIVPMMFRGYTCVYGELSGSASSNQSSQATRAYTGVAGTVVTERALRSPNGVSCHLADPYEAVVVLPSRSRELLTHSTNSRLLEPCPHQVHTYRRPTCRVC